MPDIVFATSVIPDKAIIHDDDAFRVQWKAFNAGQVNSPAFNDRLVITLIAEGCPGSDDQDHPVVYDSETDGDSQDFLEPPLAVGAEGDLMQPIVGPLAAGSYRLSVTLDTDSSMTTTFNCINIVNAA
jgi:hypothetical protein